MTHALAQERLLSQQPASQIPETPTLFALDLGTTTGWALRAPDGMITSGTASFRNGRFDGGGMRYLRFTNWLTEMDRLAGPIAWFEEVRRHAGTDAAHVYGGLMATLTAWAELRGVPYQGVPVGTIKRHTITAMPYCQRRLAVARLTPSSQQIGFHGVPFARSQTSRASSFSSHRSQSSDSSACVIWRGPGRGRRMRGC